MTNKKIIIILSILGIGSMSTIIFFMLNSSQKSIADTLNPASNSKVVGTNYTYSQPINTSTITTSSYTSISQIQTVSTTTVLQNLSEFKDGIYSLETTYRVPEGHSDKLKITLEINNGIITKLTNNHTSSNRESKEYQDRFENSIYTQVEGKSLDNINLSKVGRATLTTNAFMTMLNDIKRNARK